MALWKCYYYLLTLSINNPEGLKKIHKEAGMANIPAHGQSCHVEELLSVGCTGPLNPTVQFPHL